MTAECCGKQRRSKFCPDCGRAVSGNSSLVELIAYCRSTAKGQRKTAATYRNPRRYRPADGYNAEWCEKLAKARDQSAEKFDAWAAMLETFLDADGTNQSGPG